MLKALKQGHQPVSKRSDPTPSLTGVKCWKESSLPGKLQPCKRNARQLSNQHATNSPFTSCTNSNFTSIETKWWSANISFICIIIYAENNAGNLPSQGVNSDCCPTNYSFNSINRKLFGDWIDKISLTHKMHKLSKNENLPCRVKSIFQRHKEVTHILTSLCKRLVIQQNRVHTWIFL